MNDYIDHCKDRLIANKTEQYSVYRTKDEQDLTKDEQLWLSIANNYFCCRVDQTKDERNLFSVKP